MDKLTSTLHAQMAEEKQQLWQLIKEKGSTGAYDRYKQAVVECQQVADANGEPVEVTISEEGYKSLNENVCAKQQAFDEEIVALDRKASHLPKYSGLFEADKTIATVLENCTKEEKGYVYDIIRQNFLVENTNGMTEEERQANISLGMKKAEYAAENFVPEGSKKAFLAAMESVAKLASAGTAAEDGTMDYGVRKKSWLGEGSSLVYTDDPLDIMRRMDKDAYAEYEKINADSSNENRALDALKYMMKWYVGAVQENPKLVEQYNKQSEEYVEKNVKNQELDTTFSNVDVSSKQAFLESLKAFCQNRPGFLTEILNRELSSAFWQK